MQMDKSEVMNDLENVSYDLEFNSFLLGLVMDALRGSGMDATSIAYGALEILVEWIKERSNEVKTAVQNLHGCSHD